MKFPWDAHTRGASSEAAEEDGGWMEEGWGLKRKYRAYGGGTNIVIAEVDVILEIDMRWVALLSV